MSNQKFEEGKTVYGFVFGRLVEGKVTNVFDEGLEVTFIGDLSDCDKVSVEIEGKDLKLYANEEEAKKAEANNGKQ